MAEPPVTIRAIHDSGPGNVPTRIVIHATNPGVGFPAASAPGRARSTADYFTESAAGGSAHYITDIAGEVHCVPDNVIAWHAPPNERSIGIEICAEGGNPAAAPLTYSREQWLSPQVWPAVAGAAARTRELCDRFGIPAVRLSVADLLAGHRGICGHVDVAQAWRLSDHSDPGGEFPWDAFMAAVIGAATAPATTQRKDDDLMSAIALTFYNDDWQVDPAGLNFRGACPAEVGDGSMMIGRAWARWVAYWGPCSWRVVAWGGGKPLLEPPDYNRDSWELPPGTRGFTIEGRRATPNVIPAASMLVLPR